MTFLEVLEKFKKDISLVDISHYECFMEQNGDETMKQVVRLAQFDDEEKLGVVFSYFSERHDMAIINFMNKKINGEQFYHELKEMLSEYLSLRNKKRLDAKMFPVKKTNRELFPKLLDSIVGDYWFDGVKYTNGEV